MRRRFRGYSSWFKRLLGDDMLGFVVSYPDHDDSDWAKNEKGELVAPASFSLMIVFPLLYWGDKN